jgi:hypothetical protein
LLPSPPLRLTHSTSTIPLNSGCPPIRLYQRHRSTPQPSPRTQPSSVDLSPPRYAWISREGVDPEKLLCEVLSRNADSWVDYSSFCRISFLNRSSLRLESVLSWPKYIGMRHHFCPRAQLPSNLTVLSTKYAFLTSPLSPTDSTVPQSNANLSKTRSAPFHNPIQSSSLSSSDLVSLPGDDTF